MGLMAARSAFSQRPMQGKQASRLDLQRLRSLESLCMVVARLMLLSVASAMGTDVPFLMVFTVVVMGIAYGRAMKGPKFEAKLALALAAALVTLHTFTCTCKILSLWLEHQRGCTKSLAVCLLCKARETVR